jgi:hypothetical protein
MKSCECKCSSTLLDLGTRWRWGISFMFRPLYHWRSPSPFLICKKEKGWARACEVASHNWLPSVCSCLHGVCMMCSAVDNFASCEIRAVIFFIRVKTRVLRKSIVIYSAAVYGQNVMSEGTVRQLYWIFKYERASKCSSNSSQSSGWTHIHQTNQ